MNTRDYASRRRVTVQRVRTWCRGNLLGDAATRDERGEWIIDPERADAVLFDRLQPRGTVDVLLRHADLERRVRGGVVIWTGPGGTYEAPRRIADALRRASENPGAAVLTPELVAHLDRILEVVGPDTEDPTPHQVETAP